MISENPYESLGISKSASQDEIKKAYREKAKIHHPDKGGKEEDFKRIQHAYEILSDENKRRKYDSGGGFDGGGSRQQNPFEGFHVDNFEDLFEMFRGNREQQNRHGEHLQIIIEMTLEEIFSGKNQRISYTRNVHCQKCNGNGSKNGIHISNCTNCGGSGMANERRGFMTIRTTCQRCGGKGKVITQPCSSCNGAGKKTDNATINISIPNSAYEGTHLRVQGAGNDPSGSGVPGDLYIIIKEVPHSAFKREGNNLHLKKEISYIDAILGCELEILGIDKRQLSIKIPHGTQPNAKFSVNGEGMKIQNRSHRGDLIIDISVSIPTNISDKEREILNQIKK